jgi:hypothetical protein
MLYSTIAKMGQRNKTANPILAACHLSSGGNGFECAYKKGLDAV